MMDFFKKRRAAKKQEELLAHLTEKAIRYVARRQITPEGNTEEIVLGKGGRISCKDGLIMVDTADGEVFRCEQSAARCAQLLSRDGAVIQGVNTHTGADDTVVAYYVYFR